jgi:hypothetical protein
MKYSQVYSVDWLVSRCHMTRESCLDNMHGLAWSRDLFRGIVSYGAHCDILAIHHAHFHHIAAHKNPVSRYTWESRGKITSVACLEQFGYSSLVISEGREWRLYNVITGDIYSKWLSMCELTRDSRVSIIGMVSLGSATSFEVLLRTEHTPTVCRAAHCEVLANHHALG